MKKYILPLAVLASITIPAQANAGFLLGYMVGQSTGSAKQKVSPASAIPPACFFVENLEDYKLCRCNTAWDIYANDTKRNSDHFMQIEYEKIILPLQAQDKQTTK
jgi:hypothetical protein